MKIAIKDAGLAAEDIDYVNTHGTATGLGDIAETKAIKAVLGDHAKKIPCNSTKSMTGHLLGSAGAVEAITTILSILLIARQHVRESVAGTESRDLTIRNAVSNSFGFGGHNVTLVIGRANGDAQ